MDKSSLFTWMWIPIVLCAAFAQTVRNTAQRSLVAQAGTLGATLARFLYGIPIAGALVAILYWLPATRPEIPTFKATYFAWLFFGAASQIAATAFLLAAVKQRNFVVGVTLSKTDALQVVLFGTLFLHEVPNIATLLTIGLATIGVILLSVPIKGNTGIMAGASWFSVSGIYGLASGGCFALSAIGVRAASLQVPEVSPWYIGAWSVFLAQSFQSIMLVAWLQWRAPESLSAIVSAWRISLLAGGIGALASFGWFTALGITTAANVRALGMIEVVFSYFVGRRLLSEKLTPLEFSGLVLVLASVIALCSQL
jgi:drug/metabolite transporter (DMT)-like permease